MSQQSVTHRLGGDTTPAELIVRIPASASLGLPLAGTATAACLTRAPSQAMASTWELAIPMSVDVRRVFWSPPTYRSPAREIRPSDAGIDPEQPLGRKLAAMMRVRNGWDEGAGIRPQLPAIVWARDLAKLVGHQDAAGLRVSPSLEGGLIVERQIDGARWSLEVDRDGGPFLVVVTPDQPTETVEPATPVDAAEHLRRFLATWGRARVTA